MYGVNAFNYDDRLQRSGQLRIRINVIRLVAIEMFKYTRGFNPAYTKDMFIDKESKYNSRDQDRLLQLKFNTKRYDYRSFQFFKNLEDLDMFKRDLYHTVYTPGVLHTGNLN